MTALYRPVLIESAEQAEALPVGTIAVSRNRAGAACQASIRVGDGWLCTEEIGFDGVQDVIGHEYMVGDQALVPIEAEEEHEEAHSISMLHGGTHTWPARTRLVTPWEST